MRILITRPREDGAETATRLAASGHQPLLAPLLQPVWQDGPPPDLAGVAAILATSANGVRAFIRRSARRDIALFAVGPQTAAEAGDAGFIQVLDADGDARDLARLVQDRLVPRDGALLHISGAEGGETLARALTDAGYTVRREILYAMKAQGLEADVAAALAQGTVDAALFFSPRSARLFLDAAGALPLDRVQALCISAATAAVLPERRFQAVRIAARPNQDSLLALLEAR